jgi:hypothetical protein
MAAVLRYFAVLFALLLLGISGPARAQLKALPLNSPVTVPAVLDVITFNIRSDGEDHRIVVTPTPSLLRVDAPSDGYSLIYNPATEHYFGLENRNYTYWEFSWPEVKSAVQGTKRYETRLRDVGSDAMSTSPPDNTDPSIPGGNSVIASLLDTNSTNPNSPSSTSTSDDSGYTWSTLPDKKRIAGMECQHWNGQSLSGEPVDAWCYPTPIPKVIGAMTQLRAINDPIALVPVRELVPPFVFEIWDSLIKSGGTPLLITWGDEQDKNRFELLSIKTREGRADLFTVPRLYVKTTLITMDGIGNQKAPGAFHPNSGAQGLASPPSAGVNTPNQPRLP